MIGRKINHVFAVSFFHILNLSAGAQGLVTSTEYFIDTGSIQFFNDDYSRFILKEVTRQKKYNEEISEEVSFVYGSIYCGGGFYSHSKEEWETIEELIESDWHTTRLAVISPSGGFVNVLLNLICEDGYLLTIGNAVKYQIKLDSIASRENLAWFEATIVRDRYDEDGEIIQSLSPEFVSVDCTHKKIFRHSQDDWEQINSSLIPLTVQGESIFSQPGDSHTREVIADFICEGKLYDIW